MHMPVREDGTRESGPGQQCTQEARPRLRGTSKGTQCPGGEGADGALLAGWPMVWLHSETRGLPTTTSPGCACGPGVPPGHPMPDIWVSATGHPQAMTLTVPFRGPHNCPHTVPGAEGLSPASAELLAPWDSIKHGQSSVPSPTVAHRPSPRCRHQGLPGSRQACSSRSLL